MELKYYVYYHVRKDTNTIFYVGVGTKCKDMKYKRAKDYRGRNPIWKNIVAKTDWYVEILKEFSTKEEALEYEVRLIDMFGIINEGFQLANICKDSTSSIEIQKMASKSTEKEIHKYDLEGFYIETYNSIVQASKENNCPAPSISISANNNYPNSISSGGFRWSFDKLEKLDYKKYIVHNKVKIVYKYSLDTVLLDTFNSLEEASKSVGVTNSAISIAIGRNKTSKGFKWSYTPLHN